MTIVQSSQTAPLISIALCTYNGERYLAEQLDSILLQTYPRLEIVISDDCSSDATPALLQDYARRDSRIVLLKNAANVGFVKNFERALLACRGDYIALADQDDVWLPNKIDNLFNAIGDALLIYSRVDLIDSQGAPIDRIFPSVKRLSGRCALSLMFDNCVTGHACLLRREMLGKALPMPEGLLAHDQWLAIVAAASGRLVAGSEVLSHYRMHSSNALLQSKKKRKETKLEKAMTKYRRYVALMDAVLERNLLNASDTVLLAELKALVERNQRVFFNFALSRFLRLHPAEFLSLYKNPQKHIRKLCRGRWYFRIMPVS